MTQHTEVKTLPYTAEQLYNLVSEVDKYPEFLPWCKSSRITKREGEVFYADLIIGFKMVSEKFTSKVICKNNNHIFIDYLSGPMKYLKNSWDFKDNGDGSCTIEFFVDFKFKNFVFQKLAGVFFDDIFKRMVTAFEMRAEELYGKKT
jgi:coenzyme Q-binding protein COQ10